MKQSDFLFENTVESKKSAAIIIEELWPFFDDCCSFVDLGCGMGGWSSVFERKGLDDFRMIDHPSLPVENLLINRKENFVPINLEDDLPQIYKCDLALCIEVLEHFDPERADRLLDFIVSCADLVLFSAAIPFQKGVGHINERRHGYWHAKFKERGFSFYDGFKPLLYKYESKISFYHIQNLFIYYRESQKHKFEGLCNISSEKFEIVSTEILNRPPSLSFLLFEIPKSLLRSIKYRFLK